MTNDLQQRAKTWHFEHLPLERDDWTPSERLAHFAAAEIARERAEIADEIFLDVLKFNNDERHEHQPDPCLVCDILDATGKIWEKLEGDETESLGRIVDKLRAKL